jgi:hypothetical protein
LSVLSDFGDFTITGCAQGAAAQRPSPYIGKLG